MDSRFPMLSYYAARVAHDLDFSSVVSLYVGLEVYSLHIRIQLAYIRHPQRIMQYYQTFRLHCSVVCSTGNDFFNISGIESGPDHVYALLVPCVARPTSGRLSRASPPLAHDVTRPLVAGDSVLSLRITRTFAGRKHPSVNCRKVAAKLWS